MSDLRPVSGVLLGELGDLMVRADAGAQCADELHAEYSDVLDDFREDHRSGRALLRMGWVALKAIERCRQWEEGSDACDARSGGGDGRRSRDDVRAARARQAAADRSPGSAA